MAKENNIEYAQKLADCVQSFIDDFTHPEDGILIINHDDKEDFKVVYLEDLLRIVAEDSSNDYAEYPLLDLMVDDDPPEEVWHLSMNAFEEIADELRIC